MGRKKSQALGSITCRVKQFRMQEGLSQADLAKILGIRRQAVYDIESGRYLPNTAIALQLARTFNCRVEELFVASESPAIQPVHVVNAEGDTRSSRLAIGRVRDRFIGLPLQGAESLSFGLRSADGLLNADKKSAHILSSSERLERTIILMGCDPAFEILGQMVSRVAPQARVHCRFASSHRALDGLAEGITHVAGTHLHNVGKTESNLVAVQNRFGRVPVRILGFSLLEEGLMVAKGNPLGIRTVADLAQPGVRFVNREEGAALRVLLDDLLVRAGIAGDAIDGYGHAVGSHRDGAYRVACDVADAAPGLRAIAEAYGLDFVPLAAARCDLVIPGDLAAHPTVQILQEVLHSAALRRELAALPGYDNAVTGKTIADLDSPLTVQ